MPLNPAQGQVARAGRSHRAGDGVTVGAVLPPRFAAVASRELRVDTTGSSRSTARRQAGGEPLRLVPTIIERLSAIGEGSAWRETKGLSAQLAFALVYPSGGKPVEPPGGTLSCLCHGPNPGKPHSLGRAKQVHLPLGFFRRPIHAEPRKPTVSTRC